MGQVISTFGDKDEWKTALGRLATAGVLTYIEASDSIVLRAAEVPEGDPTTDESAADGVPDPGETPVTDVIVM